MGMPPDLALCSQEPWEKVYASASQLALSALFGREGNKMGRPAFDSFYLQVRNTRAVKLISVSNQLVNFSSVGVTASQINVE